MRVRSRVALGAMAAMLILAMVAKASAQTVQLSGTVSPDALKLPTFGDLPAPQSLPLQIWFKPRNQAQLNQLLADQQNPKSPQYHKWLTSQEYTQRFGITQAEFDKVSNWLTREGFQVTGGSPADGSIKFSGSMLTIANTFNTRVRKFSADGRKFGNVSEPELPAEYAEIVGSITGLNNLMRIAPLTRPTRVPERPNGIPSVNPRSLRSNNISSPLGSAPAVAMPDDRIGNLESFSPSDAYTFYDENPLIQGGINGNTGGDCIAIYADSDVTSNPLNSFVSTFTPSNPLNLTKINADGATLGTFSGDETEALLDIEWAHAIAPGAQIYLYLDKTGPDAIVDAVNRVSSDGKCGTVNISFSICGATSSYFLLTEAPVFAKAAAQGISIFVSSGDNGADTCALGTQNVNEMSADPSAVSVGGTEFNPNYDANGNDTGFVAESVWNDGSGATGGGASQVFSKPGFQNVAGGPSGTMRTVPDIAMEASPNSPGVFMYNDDKCGSPGGACGTNVATLAQIGGTSLSAPIWSGISKLIMQKSGTRLGSPNTTIYSLASSNASGSGFRDVVSGDNSGNFGKGSVAGFSAGSGYDEVSGWGTVDINTFVNAYASVGGGPTPTSTATSSPTPTTTPAPTTTPTPTATPTPTVAAVVKISPASVNFGNVKVGSSKTRVVTLTNTAAKKGGATVTFNNGTIMENGSDFSSTTSCVGPIPPKGRCTVRVTFSPSAPGTQAALDTVSSNASNATAFSMAGNGTCPKRGCP